MLKKSLWRVAAIARAAFGRPLMGTALSRGLFPPMLVNASAITLPSVQKAESPFKGESLKFPLGLAAEPGLLLGYKAGSMHHDLKGSMEDGSLEHSLIATANSE